MNEQGAGFHIDVYSDVVCPWCYIGKRRLEQALASVGGEIRVTWRPFQLNPTMPLDGVDRTTYLKAKFGSVEAFGQLEEQMVAAGVGEGIRFSFDKMQRTPNTFAAHRLIWHAERHGKQDAVVEALFRAYFVEAQDIGNVETLVRVAAQAGLERSATENVLASDEGVAEVKGEEAAGHKLGIRGVPHFVLNGAYAISGAQPPDRIVAALKKVETDHAKRKAGV